MIRQVERAAAILAAVVLFGGCAHQGEHSLRPGESTFQDVEQSLGMPALRWQEPDGSQVLAYPRGPAGYHTLMARIAPDGRLSSLENALEPGHFARIREGMGQDEVLQILGPPYPGWTVYFKARDELVWEWRYCDDWSEPARFNVLFDGTTGKVRTTGSLTERQRFGGNRREWCSR